MVCRGYIFLHFDEMNGNEIFTRSWCDLVFAHRNKRYGAYVLRAGTGRRYAWALGVIFALFVLFSAPPLIMYALLGHERYKPVDPVKKMARFEGIRLKEARPLRRPPRKAEPVVANIQDIKKISMPDVMETELSISHPEDEAMLDKLKPEDIAPDSIETLVNERNLKLATHGEQTSGVIIDSIPQFPQGGVRGFMKWLSANMVYPPACVREKVEGTVEVAFIVEPTGKVGDIRVLKGADPRLNHEAVRVLRKMPKWMPAYRYGKPIRSQVTLPVVFSISDFSMK